MAAVNSSNKYVNYYNDLQKNREKIISQGTKDSTTTKITQTATSVAGFAGGPVVGGITTGAAIVDTWTGNKASQAVNKTAITYGHHETSKGMAMAAVAVEAKNKVVSTYKTIASNVNQTVNNVKSTVGKLTDYKTYINLLR